MENVRIKIKLRIKISEEKRETWSFRALILTLASIIKAEIHRVREIRGDERGSTERMLEIIEGNFCSNRHKGIENMVEIKRVEVI